LKEFETTSGSLKQISKIFVTNLKNLKQLGELEAFSEI